jgi:farnesyl-diphosphate farnesyltransferase
VHHLLQEKGNAGAAVACLNEMVTDALKHVPHCLAYMERVRDWHIFRFCAIPQVHNVAALNSRRTGIQCSQV